MINRTSKYELVAKTATARIQSVTVRVQKVYVTAVHISAAAEKEEEMRWWQQIKYRKSGNSELIGNLKARENSWDTAHTVSKEAERWALSNWSKVWRQLD